MIDRLHAGGMRTEQRSVAVLLLFLLLGACGDSVGAAPMETDAGGSEDAPAADAGRAVEDEPAAPVAEDAGPTADAGADDASSDDQKIVADSGTTEPPATIDAGVDNDGDGDPASTDCDDANPSRSSLRMEVFNNGIDDDCDPTTLDDDMDGDGIAQADDCDDTDPAVGAQAMRYPDADGDTFTGAGTLACRALSAGWLAAPNGLDCDDNDDRHWNDCGVCTDDDGDGFGASCNLGADCDDSRPDINGRAPDLPDNGADEDCNGADLLAADGVGVYVDGASGNDANAGSQLAPVATIARGIEIAAAGGSPVFVAQGTYTEAIVLDLPDPIPSVHGGYDASDWSRDLVATPTVVDGADRAARITGGTTALTGLVLQGGISMSGSRSWQVTVAQCEVSGDLYEVIYAEYGSLLVIRDSTIVGSGDSGEGDATGIDSRVPTILDNNTITTGTSTEATVGIDINTTGTFRATNNTITCLDGARESFGMLIARADFYLEDNVVTAGAASRRSAGIFMGQASGVIAGGTSTGGSSAFSMGALVANGAEAEVQGATLRGAAASSSSLPVVVGPASRLSLVRSRLESESSLTESAGVLCQTGGELLAVNNIITAGESPATAALRLQECSAVVFNNTMQVASAMSARGIELTGNATTVLANNIVDMGATPGSAVWTDGMSSLTLANNDLFGSALTCNLESSLDTACETTPGGIDACAWSGCTSSAGTITDSPDFADASYNLNASSPCQGTGTDPTSWDNGWYSPDYDGDARPTGGHDIGAQEY